MMRKQMRMTAASCALIGMIADGEICKSYTEVVKTSAKTVTQRATACKAPGGGWKTQG